jgi:hypothetical protein
MMLCFLPMLFRPRNLKPSMRFLQKVVDVTQRAAAHQKVQSTGGRLQQGCRGTPTATAAGAQAAEQPPEKVAEEEQGMAGRLEITVNGGRIDKIDVGRQ